MSLIAPTLQAFFTERLITQRNASPQTIAAYRNSIRLLLRFAHEQTGKQPYRLDFADLDAPLIGAFLDHLEHQRGNTPRTRNARLAAIHSLFRYAALRHPEHAASIGRVIEIPAKRHERALICYLDLDEIKALLAAPDRTSWLGRRDHAMLLTAIQTGLRVSELVALRVGDVSLSTGAHLRVIGKGRKERCATLTPETVAVLRDVDARTPRGTRAATVSDTARRNAHHPRGRAAARQAHRHRQRRLSIARAASASRRTCSVITWTAGLCGRLGCFRLLGVSLGPVPAT